MFYIGSGKTVTIASLKIANGFALGGGGIYNDHATLTVNECTISGNTADIGSSGGGIYNNGVFLGGAATLTITNSTISGNSATGGGGIWNATATATIRNSTLSGNSATNAGGIFNNDAFGTGSPTLTIRGTILKAGASGANIITVGGPVTSLGYNLSSDAAGGDGTSVPGGFLNATGDIRNTNPSLDPNGLQDNGGPTLTIALQPDSPAINAGTDLDCTEWRDRQFHNERHSH